MSKNKTPILIIFTLFLIILAPKNVFANCFVTLKVVSKEQIISLGKPFAGPTSPTSNSLTLKPTANIPNSEACSDYVSAKEFKMNNIEAHHQAFINLQKGDVVEGTLNYHRPSPHGKMLYGNFHHGFRLLKSNDNDYSDGYIYFRHIGVY